MVDNWWMNAPWRYVPSAAILFAPESDRAKTGAIIAQQGDVFVCIVREIGEEEADIIVDEHNARLPA
jgi:hypothetical protein